jgi:hypothetical protein
MHTTQMHSREVFSDREWQPVATAPEGVAVELQVPHADGAYALPFPCVRTRDGWMNADMKVVLAVEPTQWRAWDPRDRLSARARSAAWPRPART